MSLRIKEIDALRGIAALFVVSFHYTMFREEAHLGFIYGITGVDLFFIISGFVIFMSINKVSSGLEFVVNRFTRLYPTYWACITLTFLTQVFVSYNIDDKLIITYSDYWVNLTMFQHYFKVRNLDGPYWTMIVEMVFYICMLILLATKQVKRILPFGLGLLAIIAFYCMFLEIYYPKINWDILYWFPLFSHYPLFLAGIVFYKIVTNDGKWYWNYLLIALCYIVQTNLFDNYPKAADFITHKQYMAILSVYFILFILFVNNKLGFIVSKPTLFFGKISFALYLIHQFLSINFIIPLLMQRGLNFWLSCLIALIIMIILASLITFFIEIPLGKRLNNSLRSRLNLQKKAE